MIVKLTTWLLKRSNLSKKDRMLLTNAILDKLYAIPTRDIITLNEEGRLLVNNVPLDHEKTIQLRDSARAALNSQVRNLVKSQVAYKAVTMGVHKSKDIDELYFAKAAIWWGQQEDDLLKLLAGQEDLEQ